MFEFVLYRGIVILVFSINKLEYDIEQAMVKVDDCVILIMELALFITFVWGIVNYRSIILVNILQCN